MILPSARGTGPMRVTVMSKPVARVSRRAVLPSGSVSHLMGLGSQPGATTVANGCQARQELSPVSDGWRMRMSAALLQAGALVGTRFGIARGKSRPLPGALVCAIGRRSP